MDYKNHFLFSETYLNEVWGRIKKDEIQEYDTVFENVYSWYQEYKDAWTLFEDIVLDTLGFEKVPDGLFRILKVDMGKSPVIAYLLDKECDLNSTVKGRYYAVDAVQYAKKKSISWVIVTNGVQWRLYNTTGVSPFEFYFEVDLCDALKTGKADKATRAFGRMFSAIAYRKDANSRICLMDSFSEASHSAEENIEDVLRSKAESILKGLCYGLKENMCLSVFDEKQRRQIYDDAIVLLYRLLFLGYAEARNLLPVVKGDPDYQDSFDALCRDAREYYVSGDLNAMSEGFDLWTRLDSQLRIYVDKNYNGGLFSNEDKPILREYRIANKHLAICLLELAYVAGKKKDYLQKIEYKDLSVRNLGAIYEGLLEYQLFIADELMVQRKAKEKVSYIKASETRLTNSDKNNLVQPGEIYLSQDALERKETGAYYTPEDVVEYIVKNTVGEKLAEFKKELDEELAELRDELSYEPLEQNRQMLRREIDEKTVAFIKDKILSLSIIDSAMGSGHFLVNASYFVANYVVNILEENNWENVDVCADVLYWRRQVVENCIYGIDINNLSVLLSRLSLWLISASNDKALSFVDHHLKCGNSIVGTTISKVQYFDKDIPILTVTAEQYMYPVLKKYENIREIGSGTKEDVERQHKLYDEIVGELELLKRKLDYYLASQYAGGIYDKNEYREVLSADNIDFFSKEHIKPLMKYADENQFFHWELEFPEIFIERKGFDIAIGNPPYVEVDESGYEPAVGDLAPSKNLYSYMIGNCVDKTKDDGKVGVIVLMALVASKKMNCIRKKLEGISGDIGFMSIDSATYPGRLFKGLMIRLTILTVRKRCGEHVKENNIYTTNYMRFFQREREQLFRNVPYSLIDKNMILTEKEGGFLPKIGSEIGVSVMRKMLLKTNKRMSDFIEKKENNNYLYFRNTGAVYYCMAFFEPPYYVCNGAQKKSSTLTKMSFNEEVNRNIPYAITHSTLFYWFWTVYSDCYHLTGSDVGRFPVDLNELLMCSKEFDRLAENIEYSLNTNKERVYYNKSFGALEYDQFRHRLSKDVFDQVDDLLAQYYGFTDEEAFYIRNYDIRYRTDEVEEE